MKLSKSLTLMAAFTLACTLSGTIRAQIFVANQGDDTIGEYAFDGSPINASLITGLSYPYGLAISSSDIFVANSGNGTVGEYTTSGATVNASLISGLNEPYGLAVIPNLSGGSFLFVANYLGQSVDEYSISGGVATATGLHISGFSNPSSVAIYGGDIFVADKSSGTIGEYTLSGAPVNTSLISGLIEPSDLAISGGDIFVLNDDGFIGEVGEYTTSGVTVNDDLFTYFSSAPAAGLAISGDDIFVAGAGDVGEYTTSGGTVDASLISGLGNPQGIALVGAAPTPEPSTYALMATGMVALFGLRRRK